MALIKVQTFPERIGIVRRRILDQNSDINTLPGSVAGDLFVVPLALSDVQQQAVNFFVTTSISPTELLALKQDVSNIALLATAFNTSEDDILTAISAAIDVLGANVVEVRKQPTKSTGSVFYGRADIPAGDLTVDINKTSRSSSGAELVTTGAATMFLSIIATYFDPDLGLFVIEVPVQSTQTGADSNAPASTVTEIVTPVDGFPFITNKSDIDGGTDLESDEDFVARFLGKWQAVGASTKAGVVNSVITFLDVEDTFLADVGSPFATRGLGKSDLYIKKQVGQSNTEILSAFNHPTLANAIQPAKLPILSLSSISTGDAFIQKEDEGTALAGSVQALDAIRFTTLPAFPLTVTYLYNRRVEDSQNIFDDSSLAPLNYQKPVDGLTASETPLLVKEMPRLFVDYSLKIQTNPGETKAQVVNAALTALSSFNDLINGGDKVFKSDLNEIVEATPGVLRITTVTKFSVTGQSGVLDVIEPNANQVIDLENVTILAE